MRRGRLPRLVVAAIAAIAAMAPGLARAGDALAGRALFIGARPFAAGGPPCGACHAIGGASAPFAAALGPELSRSFEGLDAAAVDGLLQDLPFPTMAPLYAGRALTPAEREDLSAFLREVAGRPPPSGAAVAGWAALLAAGCLAAMGLASRRVKGSTRAALLARAPLVRHPPAPGRPTVPPAAGRASPIAPAPAPQHLHGGSR